MNEELHQQCTHLFKGDLKPYTVLNIQMSLNNLMGMYVLS